MRIFFFFSANHRSVDRNCISVGSFAKIAPSSLSTSTSSHSTCGEFGSSSFSLHVGQLSINESCSGGTMRKPFTLPT